MIYRMWSNLLTQTCCTFVNSEIVVFQMMFTRMIIMCFVPKRVFFVVRKIQIFFHWGENEEKKIMKIKKLANNYRDVTMEQHWTNKDYWHLCLTSVMMDEYESGIQRLCWFHIFEIRYHFREVFDDVDFRKKNKNFKRNFMIVCSFWRWIFKLREALRETCVVSLKKAN